MKYCLGVDYGIVRKETHSLVARLLDPRSSTLGNGALLYLPEQKTCSLHMYDIGRKQLKTLTLNFEFP